MSAEGQCRAVLYTSVPLYEQANVEKLASCLDRPFIALSKCDTVERARKPFSASTATELFNSEGSLFLVGAKSGFKAWLTFFAPGLFGWHFYFDIGKRPSDWVDVFKNIAEILPIHFGYSCPQAEYDEEHMALPGPKGVSIAEFRQYLPGLYWLTLFGKHLTDEIGLKTIGAIPGATVTKLKGSQSMVQLPGELILDDYTERIAFAQRSADKLKAGLFFNPAKKSGYKQARQLLEALDLAAAQ